MKSNYIHQMFSQVAEAHPQRIAIEGVGKQLSYRELEEKSNTMANFLLENGARKGSLVMVMLEDRFEAVAWIIGALKAGCAFVPLESSIPLKRLEVMMADIAPDFYVVESKLIGKLWQLEAGERERSEAPFVARIICVDGVSEPASERRGMEWVRGYESYSNKRRPEVESGPDDLCYIYFTSGSTGRPKAVAGRLKAIDQFIRWEIEALGLREGTRVSQLQALSFDGSLRDIFAPLSVGGVMCVPESREIILDGKELKRWLNERKVELIHCVPSLLRMILNQGLNGDDFQSLRYVFLSGEPLLPADVGRWVDVFGERAQLINTMGTTETTMATFYYFVKPEDRNRASIPIGKPRPGSAAMIMDGAGKPRPAGMVGEIYIRTPYRSLGYYKQPELTSEVFIQNPFSDDPDDLIYKTGDLGRKLKDGNYECLGRKDEQVKIRGVRVEPREVEDTLRRHEAVKDVAVVGREDREGQKYLCAYVTLGREVKPGELRGYMSGYLPDYMIPTQVVVMDQMPRTISGKIDRKALPKPVEVEGQSFGKKMSPRTPIEEVVAGIWRQVLGTGQLGVEENFFEKGGHSLLATQVVTRLRGALQVELPLQSVFENPTIASLAEAVERELLDGKRPMAPPIERVERKGNLPLSFAQQRLWFLDQLAPGNPFYNITEGMKLEGELNPLAVQQAIGEIVRRHEVLRASFSNGDQAPAQRVQRAEVYSLPVVDLERLGDVEGWRTARRLATQEGARPFNLGRSPLMRAVLVRVNRREHAVVVNMHHIVSDAWSLGVLVSEMGALYVEYVKGGPSTLEELKIQYGDYAVWQRQWVSGKVEEEQLRYWRERLSGAPARLEMPTDYPRPAVQRYRGAKQERLLGGGVLERLQELSNRQGASLHMTLLSGFAALLHYYTGQEDIVIGTNTAGRVRAEVEGLIGLFLNTLAMRIDVSGNPSFEELLRRVREECLAAYMNQDIPLERVVQEVERERDLSRQPLFQVLFDLHNVERVVMEGMKRVEMDGGVEGLKLSSMNVEESVAQFDLVFNLWEEEKGLGVAMRYNTELFRGETISGLLERYHKVLECMVTNSEISLSDLAVEVGYKGRNLSNQFDPTLNSVTAPDDTGESNESFRINLELECGEFESVQDVFSRMASRYPGNEALVTANKVVTYLELEERSNTMANFLLENGARKGSLVVVMLEDRFEAVAWIIGALKAGCAFVPLESSIPVKRLEVMMADISPDFYIVESKLIGKLWQLEAGKRERSEARIICVDGGSEPASERRGMEWVRGYESYSNKRRPEVESGPDDLCYIYFTSGSTGRPKAVAGRLKAIDQFIRWEIEALGLREGTRVSQLQALSFDGSLRDIFAPLSVGGVICMPESREIILDGKELKRWLNERKVELIHCVPSLLRMILNQELNGDDFQSLRYVFLSGEPLLPADVGRWVDVFGERAQLINTMGTTETTMATFYYFVKPEDRNRASIPIGKPRLGSAAMIMDGAGKPRPAGMVGEICIRTPYRSLGYYKQPELTSEVFIQNPFSDDPDDLIYKTGDLGRVLDDGNYECLGRKDEQVKIRGVRVEPREVEDTLRRHEAVKDVAVVDREDREGQKYLCAYVTLGREVKPGELRGYMSGYLPDYMIPTQVVVMDQMPRTISGKIDRKALPKPVEVEGQSFGKKMSPRTPIEEVVAGIWRQVLGTGQLGVEENFFEKGGHSLLATQVVTRLRSALQVEMPLQSVFENPTIASLAEAVERELLDGKRPMAPPIERVVRDGELPLSFAQQRLWFLDQLAPGNPAYNLNNALLLTGRLSVDALEQAFGEIERRHEALRTTFAIVEGRAIQYVAPIRPIRLPVIDLTTAAGSDRLSLAKRLGRDESTRPFDLLRGPVWWAKLFKLGDDQHVILFTIHHIVSDAWSMGVIVSEMAALYEAFYQGVASPMAELGSQYADFALWQRSWLRGEVVTSELDYWKHRLAGTHLRLDLPTDRPRPKVQTFTGERLPLQLSHSLREGLRELCLRAGVTLFMTLLAAFKVLLYRYTGQNEIIIGTNVANRTRAEIEGLIGFFVNLLALRTDCSGNPSFIQLLDRVREVTLGAYTHQELPFEWVVGELQPERDLSYSPLFQVVFSFQNAPSPSPDLTGLKLDQLNIEIETAKFDLVVNMWENEQGLAGSLEYNSDLFCRSTAKRMLQDYERLLLSIAVQPDARLDELEILPEEERILLDQPINTAELDEMFSF